MDSHFSVPLCLRCLSAVLGLLKLQLLSLLVPHAHTQGEQQHGHAGAHQHKRHRRGFVLPVARVAAPTHAAAVAGHVRRYHAPHDHDNPKGDQPHAEGTQRILGTRIPAAFAAAVVVGAGPAAWTVLIRLHPVSLSASVTQTPQTSKPVKKTPIK